MIQHQTPNTSGTTNTKQYIVLHHTATGYGTINGVINHFTTGTASCHYVVDTNGDVHKFNTDNDILRHAGVSTRDGKTEMNKYSIGIEIIGPLPGFTDAERKSVRLLVLDLMQKYNIPYYRVIRHKDIAPTRKVDIYDDFRNGQYTSFTAYQQSYHDFQAVQGIYEKLFKKEFADVIVDGETIIKNIDAALPDLAGTNGAFHLKEFVYLAMIGFERVRSELLTLNPSLMGKYEKIFKTEFADLVAANTTIIKDIDAATANCINPDGTLNLKELLYLVNIGLERVRKECKK